MNEEAIEDMSEYSSGCESDTRSEQELERIGDEFDSQVVKLKMPDLETRRDPKNRQLPDIGSKKLIDMMLEWRKCLQEDELASLATIVATCGLNAVLLEVENTKQVEPKLPSLDKFLVKHMSRLEREVQEAKNKRNNHSNEGNKEENLKCSENRLDIVNGKVILLSKVVLDLGSILVKHTSKLEKEIELAKKTSGKEFEIKSNHIGKAHLNVPSLDKVLVKHVSTLEREVQKAKNMRKKYMIQRNGAFKSDSFATYEDGEDMPHLVNLMSEDRKRVDKENMDLNKQDGEVVERIVKEVEMEQSEKQALSDYGIIFFL